MYLHVLSGTLRAVIITISRQVGIRIQELEGTKSMQRYLKNHCQKKGMTSTTMGEMINQLVVGTLGANLHVPLMASDLATLKHPETLNPDT